MLALSENSAQIFGILVWVLFLFLAVVTVFWFIIKDSSIEGELTIGKFLRILGGSFVGFFLR